jgi:hypothetical protein
LFKVALISKEEISLENFSGNESEKFLSWPIAYDHLTYQKWRMGSLSATNTLFFGVFEENELKAVIEYQHSPYETGLLGFKCGSISQFFFANNLDYSYKGKLLTIFYDFFNEYRKSESIKFCFLPLSNTDSLISSVAQDAGFKYILSWGSCFYNHPPADSYLPEGFYIDFSKKQEHFDQYMFMVKNYFKGGRFYLDSHVPFEKADRLYYDLVESSFKSEVWQFATLFNSQHIPAGYFIWRPVHYPMARPINVAALRFLATNRNVSQKGLATLFLKEVSNLLMKEYDLISSGIELHNLPSLKIHNNAGYRFNYVYSAYHSWL